MTRSGSLMKGPKMAPKKKRFRPYVSRNKHHGAIFIGFEGCLDGALTYWVTKGCFYVATFGEINNVYDSFERPVLLFISDFISFTLIDFFLAFRPGTDLKGILG